MLTDEMYQADRYTATNIRDCLQGSHTAINRGLSFPLCSLNACFSITVFVFYHLCFNTLISLSRSLFSPDTAVNPVWSPLLAFGPLVSVSSHSCCERFRCRANKHVNITRTHSHNISVCIKDGTRRKRLE